MGKLTSSRNISLDPTTPFSVNNKSKYKYKYKYDRDGRVCVHHKSLSLSHEAPLCRLWGAAHSQYGGRVTWHTAVPLKILCNVTLWHMAPFLSVKWAKLVSSYVNIFSTLCHSFKAASQCTCARRVKKAWAPHPKSHQGATLFLRNNTKPTPKKPFCLQALDQNPHHQNNKLQSQIRIYINSPAGPNNDVTRLSTFPSGRYCCPSYYWRSPWWPHFSEWPRHCMTMFSTLLYQKRGRKVYS